MVRCSFISDANIIFNFEMNLKFQKKTKKLKRFFSFSSVWSFLFHFLYYACLNSILYIYFEM